MSVWQSLLTTAAEVYEPHNWWGIIGLLIVNAGVIITAVGTVVLLVQQRGVRDDTAAVKSHVVNGNPDPLRSDVDKLILAVKSIKRHLGMPDEDD